MRDFFINMLEKLINVLVIILLIGVLFGTVATLFIPSQNGIPSALVAVGVLIGGLLYVTLMAGFMYLGLGIYQNTRRTAAAMEELAAR
ncbi:hypothetical protein [Pararhodobacter sp. CCB-MM2]|uniref:hypothetical protein n=1 Tax=Pararhodobacter sp. CCB-MM2 TaxID=1786003 RepID=UPI000836F5D2|nr:hypothetical protein [Pararhodobacter sp. CCB-MM2]MCA2013883.1 hypothetical protein [Cereibacter sphaeroides]